MATPEEELLKTITNIVNKRQQNIEKLKKEIELEKEKLDLLTDIEEKAQKRLEISKKEVTLSDEELIDQQHKLKNAEKLLEDAKKLNDVSEEHLNNLKEQEKIQRDQYEEAKKHWKEKKDILDKEKKAYEETNKTIKEQEETYQNIENTTERIITILTGISSDKSSLISQLLSAEDIGKAIASIGKGIAKAISLTNIFKSSLLKVEEATGMLIKEQDFALASFNRATGAIGEYDNMIVDLGKDHLTLGISTEDAAKSIESLRRVFTDFTLLNRQTQRELSLFSATMEKLGVDSETTAENIQGMTKSLGLNVNQAMTAQKEIVATGVALGLSPKQMAEDFRNALPSLTAFGDTAIQKFKELSAVAKSTGIQVSSLIGITKQFDTFASAGEAVGKLNQILSGGFLDSMTMIKNVDPADRIRMLGEAFKKSGKSLDTMTEAQRYYFLQSVRDVIPSLKDEGEVRKLLTGDIDKNIAASQKEALTQKQMADMTKITQSITDKLRQTMMMFAVSMRPVIDVVRGFIDKILQWNEAWGGKLIPIVVSVTGVLFVLNRVVKNGAGILTGFISKIWAKITARNVEMATDKALNKVQKEQTATTKASVGPMLALGLAIMMIGAGVALATAGIALLAKSLKGISLGEGVLLVTILTMIGVGLYFLATASLAASAGMIPLGIAVGLIGAGIFLIMTGIALVIKSLTGFFALLLQHQETLGAFALNLTALSLAMILMLPGAIMASIGLTALAVGMGALALSLALIKTKDLMFLTIMFMSLSKFSERTVSALSGVAEMITKIAKAMGSIPDKKVISFNSTIQSLSSVVEASNDLEPVSVENTRKLVDQAQRYKEIVEETKVNNVTNSFTNFLTNTASSGAGGTSGTGGFTVILQLDGKEIDKRIVDVMNKKMSPRRAI